MTRENPYILGSNGQRSRSRGTKKQCRRGFLHSCECWLLVIVVDDSSGCVCDSGGDDAYDNDNGGDGINNISSTRA